MQRRVRFMTRNISGLNLQLEEDQNERFEFHVAYHSHTRFATSESDVEVLIPFCATASSNINLSSPRGRYGSGKFIVDIAA